MKTDFLDKNCRSPCKVSHTVNFFTIMTLTVSRLQDGFFILKEIQKENLDCSWTINITDNFCLTHVTVNDQSVNISKIYILHWEPSKYDKLSLPCC